MKAYQQVLQSKGYEVTYIEAKDKLADIRNLLPFLKKKGISEIHCCDVTDYLLERRIAKQTETLKMNVVKHDSRLFILTGNQINHYFIR